MKLFSLPNLFTLANLFSGCLACIFLIKGFPPTILVWFLIASLIFDFFDGFIARFTKTNSELGVQLDSLADMVTFGFFPGLLMSVLLMPEIFLFSNTEYSLQTYILNFGYLGLFITLFSALRLAKFNIDKEQTYYFKGLPTPANAILIFSIYWLINENKVDFLMNQYILLGITAISCYLLIANIPLFALKFKGFKWNGNELKIIFLFVSSILLIFFQMLSVPLIILCYIIVSIICKKKILEGIL